MSNAVHNIERQIARVQNECAIRRDLHGRTSNSYRLKRAKLADLKNKRRRLKIEAALGRGAVLA